MAPPTDSILPTPPKELGRKNKMAYETQGLGFNFMRELHLSSPATAPAPASAPGWPPAPSPKKPDVLTLGEWEDASWIIVDAKAEGDRTARKDLKNVEVVGTGRMPFKQQWEYKERCCFSDQRLHADMF